MEQSLFRKFRYFEKTTFGKNLPPELRDVIGDHLLGVMENDLEISQLTNDYMASISSFADSQKNTYDIYRELDDIENGKDRSFLTGHPVVSDVEPDKVKMWRTNNLLALIESIKYSYFVDTYGTWKGKDMYIPWLYIMKIAYDNDDRVVLDSLFKNVDMVEEEAENMVPLDDGSAHHKHMLDIYNKNLDKFQAEYNF